MNLFRCDARVKGEMDLFLDLDLFLEDTLERGDEDFLRLDDILVFNGERDLLGRNGERDLFLLRVGGDFLRRDGEADFFLDDDNGFLRCGEIDVLDTGSLLGFATDLSLVTLDVDLGFLSFFLSFSLGSRLILVPEARLSEAAGLLGVG